MMWMREAGLIKNPKLNIGFKLDCHSQKKENTSPESFFQIVYNIFQQTEKTAGKPIELFYDIAGYLCFGSKITVYSAVVSETT